MIKYLTSVILAGAMMLSAGSAQAEIRDDQLARALLGALLLYGLAEAVQNEPETTPHYVTRAKPKRPAPTRHLIPAKCAAVYDTAEGARRLVRAGCLKKAYRHNRHLPANCRIRTFTTKGWIEGYRARCLRRAGFSIV